MDLEEVERIIRDAGVETVKIGGADMDGVYRGKRVLAGPFLDGCRGHGFPQCDVIFGWDIAEQVIDGLAVGTADTGFADIVMVPDLSTFRLVPWETGAAAVICDYITESGEPLDVSPRTVLRRVVDRAVALGFRPCTAAEFEVRLFREDQRSLREKSFANLEPLSPGLNCYSIHHASLDEDIVGHIRRDMVAYGVPVEGYNREHGTGMYEMNIHYADAIVAADHAMLYKSGSKEIAAKHGAVPTFMAKYDDTLDGCSGHLHQSLWSANGERPLFWEDSAPYEGTTLLQQYAAGVLATLPEFMLMYAPNINSYKRFVAGSWAPTSATWGIENRTAALRVIGGSAGAIRIENRVPGADVNAYLGFAATIAGGLHGIEQELSPPAQVRGDAYKVEAPPLPRTLGEAVESFERSSTARKYFGDAFVDHYARMRRWEAETFNRAVTDWERARYFEQV
jgi:glutamine synthetase